MVLAMLGSPLLVLTVTAAVFLATQMVHLVAVMSWCDARTTGIGYYGRSQDDRSRFKTVLRAHRAVLAPILWLLSRTRRFRFEDASFSLGDVAGPKGTCRREDFERAAQYQPQPDDVFVVTQMKCGTTWMQHLVFQVLTRGGTDLAESGTALYAVSPWLESCKTVTVDAAPRFGIDRPRRTIKTHLPTSICPYSPEAKYIYVVRHPVSCFASCVDFIRSNLGQFAPSLEQCESWFRSDKMMWWGTWPTHVAGWWSWAQQKDNVLFIRFQDMKRDLSEVVRQVAGFLEVTDLDDDALQNIVHRCSFQYMQQHADSFEMHPPHLLQANGRFFVSGKISRYQDIPQEMADRISDWCRRELSACGVPDGQIF